MTFLDDKERSLLKDRHKRERDRRICDRIKAVLLGDKGWSPAEIAEALLLSEDTIRDHLAEYKNSQKLQPKGGGSVEKFSAGQVEQLEAHLCQHTYLYVKDIAAYVQATFNIAYSIHGLRSWLQRHGFSYKKPSIVPGKANKEQQQQWLSEYTKLRKGLSENETICFLDGVHPTHNVQTAYGWIKKGIRKEIPANTGRCRLNLSGAIDVVTHDVLVREDETLDATSTIRFLQELEAAYPYKHKIHAFCDNAPYYRNKAVRQYLQTSKIILHFLPAYSPNLNPIERLWKWMKERVLYNTYYREFDDFKTAVLGFFTALSLADKRSELGQCLRRRVRDQFSPIGGLTL